MKRSLKRPEYLQAKLQKFYICVLFKNKNSIHQLHKAAHQATVNTLIDTGIDVWADCAGRLRAAA